MAKKIAKKKSITKKPKSKMKREKTLKKRKIVAKLKKKTVAKKAVVKKKVPKRTVKKQKIQPKPKVVKAKIVKVEKPLKKKLKVKVAEEPKVQVKVRTIEEIKGYSKKDLQHFRQIILEKRDEIIEQLQNLKEQMLDPTTGEYINENSPYSLHMAEQGTDAMEREKTFLYAQRENKFLGYLEDALKRIDAGTYGICVECVEEPQFLCETCPLVPKPRLEAVPHSQLCLPIKQKQERNR
ncbi:MAG: conjugal transfer protein TraR [Ignavibacteria bacterium RIFOXYB2_FULL_35_12]|nr:MAG: conjugal transfer protein TraR [Ignavibacteria bacterium GWA2_36_19]OGU60392.1 MAG: conjugal transfer protein TraR [Ignavibacteria bacterium GWF2_35_20]OGU84290.1 MAG: conjugal transfer protein TraR [Ignavibacteria bacterium RIFOXYA12_FULL_35_25]OGU88561.1 MAG: conjugal transfer protein TraR [Ignavibacteria bacterium RIFOXYC12_FULL_35_11]OGU95960.1 MAG: conjugal transfer protein TraR [Ignavibacteria bacterium RIFOXYB12_FULL_35_14]OGV01848.1 MAG: conjugal transfer protein TraR [Ignaviba